MILLLERLALAGLLLWLPGSFAEDENLPNAIQYPTIRFNVWSYVDADIRTAASSIGYTEVLWNTPGSFNLELERFENLQNNVRRSAVAIGLNEEVWDCYVNHYRGYSWNELEDLALDVHYVELGFDALLWSAESNLPHQVDGRLWDQLSLSEQLAAQQVCYFAELWDGIPLDFWGLEQPSHVPSFRPSYGPTVAPSLVPTFRPSIAPSAVPTLRPTPSTIPLLLPALEIESVDYTRHVPWHRLDADLRSLLGNLAYTEETWNVPGAANVEMEPYDHLNKREREAVTAIGLDNEQWDCWINHYRGYDWDQMNADLRNHMIVLGFSEDNWYSFNRFPEGTGNWDTLSFWQRTAATAICYQQESWDAVPLGEWSINNAPTFGPSNAPSVGPSVVPTVFKTAKPTASPTREEDRKAMPFPSTIKPTSTPSARPVAQPPVPIKPVSASLLPSMTTSTVAPTSRPTSQVGVSIPLIVISWTGIDGPVDPVTIEQAIIDYLTAYFVIGSRTSFIYMDASATLVGDTSAVVSGRAFFGETANKPSEDDLEALLIVHFASTGTQALQNHLRSNGVMVTGTMQVEVAGFDTTDPSRGSSSNAGGGSDIPWPLILVLAMAVIGIGAAVVLIMFARKRQRARSAAMSRAPRQGQTPPTPAEIHYHDTLETDSLDQSLYTTDDSYLQTTSKR